MSTTAEEVKAKEFINSFINATPAEKAEVETPKKPSEIYRDLPVAQLPLGRMYHPNTRIEFRALDVGEILNYSTLETNDVNLVRPKLDEILEKCVRITLHRQKLSYKTLFIQDRLYMIYTIREITFQNGRMLHLPVTCSNPNCNHEFDIELLRQNMEMHSNDEEIWKFFKPEYGCFVFNTTIQEEPYYLRPPTIGLQDSFYQWIQDQSYKNKTISEVFLKISPYMVNANELSIDDISKMQEDFINGLKNHPSGEAEFEFLNDTVDNFKKNIFKIGVKGMMKQCPKCGTEVRTPAIFPRRARDLFIVPNAFRHYLKK